MGLLSAKLYKIGVTFIFLILLLCARLAQLQIHLSKKFYRKSQKNFLRVKKTDATRGNILDINNKLIATNKPVHNLYWQGISRSKLSKKNKENLKLLEKIIDKKLHKKLLKQINHANRYNKKLLIAKEITFDQLSKIEEQLSSEPCIKIETSFKRFYPYQNFASHILGYLGRIELEHIGKMGLEKIFEDTLRGKSGSIITTINSFGAKLSESILEDSLSGQNIKITIDICLQNIVEKIFPKDSAGTCIVMDPYDGSIVALVSRPNFDPNIFLSPISQKEWDNLQANHPFLNRAFNACYPPGSLFKLVTMSAALEHNIVTPQDTYDCKGYIHFGRRKYLCHKHDGHGILSASQALEQSCNVLFYEIAKKIDIDLLAEYAYKFGLGQKTGVLFPEKEGLTPTRAWKLENKGERWYKGETLSASIGQSFLSITPIQAARMISSIFTGYLVNPRMLEQEPIITKDLAISPQTIEFLKQSMKKVVTQGTGKNISKIQDFDIYAKTSTAQTSDLRKRKLGEIYREHRWFVAYLKYKEKKPLTFTILIEHAKTPTAAKRAAKKFLLEYKSFIDRNL